MVYEILDDEFHDPEETTEILELGIGRVAFWLARPQRMMETASSAVTVWFLENDIKRHEAALRDRFEALASCDLKACFLAGCLSMLGLQGHDCGHRSHKECRGDCWL